MKCWLCTWLCDRFCAPESSGSALWRSSFLWEEAYASDWEPAEPGADLRKRWAEAKALEDDSPAAALAIHRELADGGSPFSMLKTGWFYEGGVGVEEDATIAEDFYRRALSAGSWKATLGYARLLFNRGAHDKWPSTLGDGVDKGFVPAFFWLAWYKHEHSPSRTTAGEVRHLLETAAEAGHPGARLALARWTASGKFGLRQIPRGFRMLRALFRWLTESASGAVTASQNRAAVDREPDPGTAELREEVRAVAS